MTKPKINSKVIDDPNFPGGGDCLHFTSYMERSGRIYCNSCGKELPQPYTNKSQATYRAFRPKQKIPPAEPDPDPGDPHEDTKANRN